MISLQLIFASFFDLGNDLSDQFANRFPFFFWSLKMMFVISLHIIFPSFFDLENELSNHSAALACLKF